MIVEPGPAGVHRWQNSTGVPLKCGTGPALRASRSSRCPFGAYLGHTPSGPEPAILKAVEEPLARRFLGPPAQKSANPPASPGGRVEPGETAAEAAGRGVREETGLRVSVGELLWVREYLPERHSGNPYHRTQLRQGNAPVYLGDLL